MALPTLLPYERWKEAHPADISDHSKNFVCRIYLSHYFYLEQPLIFVPLSMHICIFPLYQTRSLYVCSMPIRMKHVSMMHACVMHVKNGDGRTNGRTDLKLNSRSRICICLWGKCDLFDTWQFSKKSISLWDINKLGGECNVCAFQIKDSSIPKFPSQHDFGKDQEQE